MPVLTTAAASGTCRNAPAVSSTRLKAIGQQMNMFKADP